MEKFQKYCLSVLLVIICSNISAQISNGAAEAEDCGFYEIYSQFLNHECEASQKCCIKEKPGHNFAIHHKQDAAEIFGRFFTKNQQSQFYKNKSEANFFEKEKHDKHLKNFEKSNEENLFAETLYFKAKVTKIRNKDDLNGIG